MKLIYTSNTSKSLLSNTYISLTRSGDFAIRQFHFTASTCEFHNSVDYLVVNRNVRGGKRIGCLSLARSEVWSSIQDQGLECTSVYLLAAAPTRQSVYKGLRRPSRGEPARHRVGEHELFISDVENRYILQKLHASRLRVRTSLQIARCQSEAAVDRSICCVRLKPMRLQDL